MKIISLEVNKYYYTKNIIDMFAYMKYYFTVSLIGYCLVLILIRRKSLIGEDFDRVTRVIMGV